MTAYELLDRIKKLRKTIDYKRTRIETLRAAATKVTSCITGMPRNPSPDTSPMATAICEMLDIEREVEQLVKERNAAIATIDQIEDTTLSRILILRYAEERPWDTIMAAMGYGHTLIHRLPREAIKKLDEILKDGTKWD